MSGGGLRVCKDGVTSALLHLKLPKPYSRTQTIFVQNVGAHNEYQWKAPDFGRWSGVSGTANLSGKYKFSLLDVSERFSCEECGYQTARHFVQRQFLCSSI
jgi:hypothetical protein